MLVVASIISRVCRSLPVRYMSLDEVGADSTLARDLAIVVLGWLYLQAESRGQIFAG
jgi:hypothetical protein